MRKPIKYFLDPREDSITVLWCLCDDNSLWMLRNVHVSGTGLTAQHELKWVYFDCVPEIPQKELE